MFATGKNIWFGNGLQLAVSAEFSRGEERFFSAAERPRFIGIGQAFFN